MIPLHQRCSEKLGGGGEVPAPSELSSFLSGTFALISTGVLVAIEDETVFSVVAPSFAATIVLLYSAPLAPFSQPRNVILGHTIGAVIGCSTNAVFEHVPELSNHTSVKTGLGVGGSVAVMQALNVVHPPGAATAFIASSEEFMFIISPVLVGAVTLCLLSILLNNVSPHRKYPSYY